MALCRGNKTATAEKFGEPQVKLWRRSYDIRPPVLEAEDLRHPRHDARYRDLSQKETPAAESLKDTLVRFLPCWHDRTAQAVRSGKRVLIAAHGNSLPALVKYLDNVSDEDIVALKKVILANKADSGDDKLEVAIVRQQKGGD
jgi:2,3-bisphosphoglycerate-dependent phosphoglycerate mutase